MKTMDLFAFICVLVGGINWGLIGVFDFNLVEYLFGPLYIDRIIYVVVGISAVYLLMVSKSLKKHVKKKRG